MANITTTKRVLWIALLAVLPLNGHTAESGCAGYVWNVSNELALYQQTATVATLSGTAAQAPQLSLNRLYRLQLQPQADVHFVHAPGKTMLTGGDYAGIASFEVPSAGVYRVAIDEPFWIDLVQDGHLARTVNFTGQPHCSGPRKIVKFQLNSKGRVYLQLSGNPKQSLRVTLTPDTAPIATAR